jgi:hypothetical protein
MLVLVIPKPLSDVYRRGKIEGFEVLEKKSMQ